MLNEFYFRLCPRDVVNNMKTLRLAGSTHINIDNEQPALTSAYWKYLDHRGSPTHFDRPNAPISEACSAELRQLYAGERGDLGLDWIPRLRHKHGLDHCPFCGSSMSVELEHYFPEDVYPEYVTLSWNLIPTCGLCNKRRGKRNNNPGEWSPLFHPYFEDILHVEPILFSDRQIIDGQPVFIAVIRTDQLPTAVAERAKKHYETCIHPDQFDTVLSSEWRSAIKEAAAFAKKRAGLTPRDFIKTNAECVAEGAGINSWKAVFYRSLEHSESLMTAFENEVRNHQPPALYRLTRYSFESPAWSGIKFANL